MSIQVDAASATISVDPVVRNAKPKVDIIDIGPRKLAFAHLTHGVNVAKAVAGQSPVDDPVIKMTGKFDVVMDLGDDANMPGWKFGFLQVGNVMVLEDLYVGRTLNEGHVKMRYRLKVSPTILLDSIPRLDPFTSLAPVTTVEVKDQKRIIHHTCHLGSMPNKKGDSPMGSSGAIIGNRNTNAPNFLFEYRADLGFTSVLAAIDPQKVVLPLAHVNWHLIWFFHFTWKGGQNPTAIALPVTSRADIGAAANGMPADANVAAVVKVRKGPFFNDVTDAAKKDSVLGQAPEREDNYSRPSGIPADFFK